MEGAREDVREGVEQGKKGWGKGRRGGRRQRKRKKEVGRKGKCLRKIQLVLVRRRQRKEKAAFQGVSRIQLPLMKEEEPAAFNEGR